MNGDLQTNIDSVELDFLERLVSLLRDGSVSLEQGKQITTVFLSLTPFTSADDLQTKLKPFTDTYKDFAIVYINLLNKNERKKTDELLTRMRAHLKENNIDEALQLVSQK